MKKVLILSTLLLVECVLNSGVSAQSGSDYPIKPVLPIQVKLSEGFWHTRLQTNHKVTLPYCFQKCEETDRIENFISAGKVNAGEEGAFRHVGLCFNDSDVTKVIEGAAYVIAANPDPELEVYVNKIIGHIAKAQEPDGYLYTIRTVMDSKNLPSGGRERWTDIAMGHELYNLGHMYEAGAAWYEATGNRNLLDICIKSADFICTVFGPQGRHEPPGHQEIEVGLAKLYRVTGDKKYLDMAKFFLDRRGRKENRPRLYGEYSQDHKPVLEQEEAVGHSVRAMYMLMGMADVAALAGDQSYIVASHRLWDNVVGKKLYITGGVGAAGGHEGFGGKYELPNPSAYCETCAAIANAFWNWRLFLMTGDSKYADMVDLIIHNGFLSGISMEGNTFFYPNPLESFRGGRRSPWFDCSCCPSNIVRFVSQIPGMAYAVGNENGRTVVYVNLFLSGTATLDVAGRKVEIAQKTNYPWDGKVEFAVNVEGNTDFDIHIRKPGWLEAPVPSDLYWYAGMPKFSRSLGYDKRTIKNSTSFSLDFPMTPRRVLADENVIENRGKVSVMRGPIVFCLEAVDQPDGKVLSKMLPDDATLTAEFQANILGGVYQIRAEGREVVRGNDEKSVVGSNSPLTFIPYYAWAHRTGGEMTVWLARTPEAAKPQPRPTIAFRSRVTTSRGAAPQINDQLLPRHSNDKGTPYWHTWPEHGKPFWVQYDFAEPAEVKSVSVYWLDETSSNQACKVPKSWKLLAKMDGEWKEVESPSEYGTKLDQMNTTTFKPVKAEGLRIEAVPQDNWCGGLFEWTVQ